MHEISVVVLEVDSDGEQASTTMTFTDSNWWRMVSFDRRTKATED